jgi:3-methyl-2-oxobutanoate hydroxymethyltransferase
MYDALGLYPEPPPFAKRFVNLGEIATDALRTYAREVRDGTFPPPKA